MNDVVCGNGFLTRGQNVRDSLQRWPASKSRKVFRYYDKIDGITVLKVRGNYASLEWNRTKMDRNGCQPHVLLDQ